MKKLLVLTAVLFAMASMSQASILECWMTFDTGSNVSGTGNAVNPVNNTSAVGQIFTVDLWLRIVVDPSIPGESLTGGGLESTALSVSVPNISKVAESVPQDPVNSPNVVMDSFPNTGNGGLNMLTIDASRQAGGTAYGEPAGDTNLDAIQASGATKSTGTGNKTCAINSNFLYVQEDWTLEQYEHADLLITVAPTSRHWNSDGTKSNFTQIETGTIVNGVFTPNTELYVGPAAPEPATLALLGFGAVATLLRRRNKK
jgi:hypothetical protein